MTRLLRAVFLAAGVLGCVACSRTATETANGRHPWTHPGELRIATIASINTLNPILSTISTEAFAQQFVLEPLIATAPDGQDVPVLASVVPTVANGGISRDGLTITYHLRHGVRWQDGAPFSSRDVAFTVAAIMNRATNVTSQHGYDDIVRVDTPDAYTATFHLEKPFAPAVDTFFATSDTPYFILPAHLLAKYHDLNHVPFNVHPIGTGPFKLVRWVRGDRIEYVANDAYYRGAPKLRSIVLRIAGNEETMVNQLRAHEVDYLFAVHAKVYPGVRGVDGVRTDLVPLNAYTAIMVNVAKPPFDDPRVRRALALAVDKKRIVEDATYGTHLPAREDIPPNIWAYDPKAGTDVRDLAAAKSLLDEAGWRAASDGTRTKNSVALRVGLGYTSEDETTRQIAVLVADQLREAGFALDLKGYARSLYYAPAPNGPIAGGRYQLAVSDWISGADPDDSTQLLCDQVAPKGWNWPRYCSPAMDAAQRRALTLYDRPQRKAAYATIEELLARDIPFAYLSWWRQVEPYNTDFHGFRPTGYLDSWNSWEWSI